MRDQSLFSPGHLVFNGVHGRTGAYLTPPLAPTQIARVAHGHKLDDTEFHDLGALLSRTHLHHRGPAEGIDPDDLAQTGWAVIFPLAAADGETAKRHAAIREALSPLLELRRAQAGARCERHYRELIGKNDAYRPNETKRQFLARLGVEPGPADPERLPYYLLLVGSPEEIPYHVEHQLDVQYAVGRIHFDTLDEYAQYARSVVEAETGGLVPSQRAVLFGAANPGDPATALTRRFLVEPLATLAEREAAAAGWSVDRISGEQATKGRLAALFGDDVPGLLFTATHGVAFDADDTRQRDRQGALLCQDWRGPGTGPTSEMYFAGEDLAEGADLRGLITFHFACFSVGTPKHDTFARKAFGKPRSLAPSSFVARLPQRLLGRAGGGALAAVGHVDRAWGCSFVTSDSRCEDGVRPRTATFESTLTSLLHGHRLGHAVEYFNLRYAESAVELTERLQAAELYREPCPEEALAMMWLESNDARNYAIIGDPAVRLAVDRASCDQGRRPASRAGSVPTVSSGSARSARSEPSPTDDFDPVTAIERLTVEAAGWLRALLPQLETTEIETHIAAPPVATRGSDPVDPPSTRPTLAVASTRIGPGGHVEVRLPAPNGALEERLWAVHQAAVEQAWAERREAWSLLRSLLCGQTR